MRGLVVGRFQPVHMGHIQLIQTAIEDCVEVVVAVGSSNAPASVLNPFSYAEREAMLKAALGSHVTVLPLPDIHDPPNWVAHVMKTIGPVDKVFGNDDRTLDLFEDADVPVVRPGLANRENWEASTIRMQMAEDDPTWRKSVPKPVIPMLEQMDGPKRVRLLEARA